MRVGLRPPEKAEFKPPRGALGSVELVDGYVLEAEAVAAIIDGAVLCRRSPGARLRFLPKPPITRDQVKLLKADNIVNGIALGLADLGIEPQSLQAILPIYRKAVTTRRR